MINVYLNRIEKELDNLLIEQKVINDELRIVQDVYSAIEKAEAYAALRISILYSIIKFKSDLSAVNKKIDASYNAIKELHKLNAKEKKERLYEREQDTGPIEI